MDIVDWPKLEARKRAFTILLKIATPLKSPTRSFIFGVGFEAFQ